MARGREERVLCFRDLRDVTIAIAILFIVLSIAGIVVAALAWTVFFTTSVTHLAQYNDPAESGYETSTLVSSTAAAVLVVSLLGLLLSILLLHAALRGKKPLILPWLVYYGLLFLLLTVLSIISLVMACIAGLWPGIVASIIEIFAVLVLWSWFAAVWAHYVTM